MKAKIAAMVALILVTALVLPALAQDDLAGDLPRSKLTMQSVLRVDLHNGIATVPLHRGTHHGMPVWYVRMDVSDGGLAGDLGLNFAPRLANAANGCPACVQTVKSADPVLGRAPVEFAGTIDFSPQRILVPSETGFPPLQAQPGAVAGRGYSDLVRVEGSPVVFNAPIVAVGDGPFDVTTHTNTNDRVMAIDTRRMTVDLQFVRAFAHGRDIFYFTFGSSGALSAVLERGTFVPVLGTLPFANESDNPEGARSAIFTFTNGQRGQMSPPAQGLMHVILDAGQHKDLNLQNTDVLEALRLGGDAHNVLDSFPTLADPHLARLYSPMWDLHIGVWSPEVVAKGQNVAQTDANQIRQLAVQGIVTSPGGGMLGSANFVVNCPVLGFANEPPTAPQAPNPMRPTPEGAPVFFPQTGVRLGGEFLNYWRANGGLPVFGYPISSEQESNGRVVQWFERTRFELHPENGAPYQVLLGRIGVEVLQRQGRDWQAFPKADPSAAHYFPETGHAIAPEFRSYWRSYGLELGDGGVSTRESLALFGYPISEPQMETGAGDELVLTQWFERARFEYHPNNPAPYQVLLGLLGTELR